MFSNWTRHGKSTTSGNNDLDRTPNNKHIANDLRLSAAAAAAFNNDDAVAAMKPKGRRLTDDAAAANNSRFLKVSALCDSWTKDWRQQLELQEEEDKIEQHFFQGAMSSDLTRMGPPAGSGSLSGMGALPGGCQAPPTPSSMKMRVKGPASSGTALSSSSYQILLPQRSTPLDQSQPQIRFSTQTPPYPSWTMSVGIPQNGSKRPDDRRYQYQGPGSANLISENFKAHQRTGGGGGALGSGVADIPSIMVDPYSSGAREFIASRQLLFLTRRRVRAVSQDPHVWIMNYYGRASAKALQPKIVPGSSLSIADTNSFNHRTLNCADGLKMSRLLGYQEIDDLNPSRARLRFVRLIGRGGTSAVYSGITEISWENAMLDAPSPVVAKILNPKHWKCALAELVSSAAAIHRVSEGTWLQPERRSSWSKRDSLTSPTSASSRYDFNRRFEDCCPFVQGGVWLMPTELHLFWDFERPLAATEWSPLKKKIANAGGQSTHPRFSQNELPSLCCLVLRDTEDGVPLLTWLNTVYVKRRRKPSHEMCLYFAYTIITLVRQLHSCGLIHGDIKPDNFVLLSSSSPYANKDMFNEVQVRHPLLNRSSSGICPVTIAGIDFGRSLDVKESLRDVIFIGDTQVSDFRCPPMLEKSRWETQIDLTGLAVTIFTMISLKYPKIRKKKAEALMMSSPLSLGEARGKVNHSYWFGSRIRGDLRQNDFWLGILDRLINFDPFHTKDGHTLLDSCLLLRQLELELISLFDGGGGGGGVPGGGGSGGDQLGGGGGFISSDLRASYEALYSELNEMQEFVLEYQKKSSSAVAAGGGQAPPVMI